MYGRQYRWLSACSRWQQSPRMQRCPVAPVWRDRRILLGRDQRNQWLLLLRDSADRWSPGSSRASSAPERDPQRQRHTVSKRLITSHRFQWNHFLWPRLLRLHNAFSGSVPPISFCSWWLCGEVQRPRFSQCCFDVKGDKLLFISLIFPPVFCFRNRYTVSNLSISERQNTNAQCSWPNTLRYIDSTFHHRRSQGCWWLTPLGRATNISFYRVLLSCYPACAECQIVL